MIPFEFATMHAPTMGTPKFAVDRCTGTLRSWPTTAASFSRRAGMNDHPSIRRDPAHPDGPEAAEGAPLHGDPEGAADVRERNVGELGMDQGAGIVRENVVAHGVLAVRHDRERGDLLELATFVRVHVARDDDPLRIGGHERSHHLTVEDCSANDADAEEPPDVPFERVGSIVGEYRELVADLDVHP